MVLKFQAEKKASDIEGDTLEAHKDDVAGLLNVDKKVFRCYSDAHKRKFTQLIEDSWRNIQNYYQ